MEPLLRIQRHHFSCTVWLQNTSLLINALAPMFRVDKPVDVKSFNEASSTSTQHADAPCSRQNDVNCSIVFLRSELSHIGSASAKTYFPPCLYATTASCVGENQYNLSEGHTFKLSSESVEYVLSKPSRRALPSGEWCEN